MVCSLGVYHMYVRCLANSLLVPLRPECVSVCLRGSYYVCALACGRPLQLMAVWPVLPFRPWTAVAVFCLLVFCWSGLLVCGSCCLAPTLLGWGLGRGCPPVVVVVHSRLNSKQKLTRGESGVAVSGPACVKISSACQALTAR